MIAFDEFQDKYDIKIHKANLAYFQDNPAIIKKIKSDLNAQSVQWRLEKMRRRAIIVPENRKEYAELYENYCRELVDYVLRSTGFENPYQRIQTLSASAVEKPLEGISAFLVHNLAVEYRSHYIFHSDDDKKVRIKLNQTVFSGKVGAYTSYISVDTKGSLNFEKEPYTIWQNSAKNPFTALMVPAEETLHILLRDHTEMAIKAAVARQGVSATAEVKKIADEWIAVEEAIVGGTVHALVPVFLEKRVDNLPAKTIKNDIESKKHFKQYRYLQKAIDVIEQIGFRSAIGLYQENPRQFKRMIMGASSNG